jgi:hypothetical protein
MQLAVNAFAAQAGCLTAVSALLMIDRAEVNSDDQNVL